MKKTNLKCLICYLPIINENIINYHPACSKYLFDSENPPIINFGLEDIEQMAKKTLTKSLAVSGVQPKVSINLEKEKNETVPRFTIVGLWGNYILKPASTRFQFMPEVEDATMKMAHAAGIKTASHGLIKLTSGDIAYITKRFDRLKNKKIATEDFCQLSELPTESKYDVSTEKAGKIVSKFATNSGLELVKFFDLNIFCFLTGNSDMHLKNFSLIRNSLNEIELSPAYDLLSTILLLPEDKEMMALTVNGKKNKIRKNDFNILAKNLNISDKVVENSFDRLKKSIPEINIIINNSFMPDNFKNNFKKLIIERSKILDFI